MTVSLARMSVALKHTLATVCLFLMSVPLTEGQDQLTVAECDGMKIAILDLSELAGIGNFPKCSLDEVVQVNIGNGIVYSKSHEIPESSPHMFGTHSAPWFLYEAIKSSPYHTTDLESADIVFVYDYCYYISWVGDVHSFGRERADGPGDYLFAAYTAMMQTPAWKKFEGGNFAFYDSHPGFMAGKAAVLVQNMKCINFRNAIHMIVDTPMRNVCEGYLLIKKILVTPYVPNPLDIANPEAYLQQPYVPLAERKILAYSRARCHPYKPPSKNAGKLMRYWFSFEEWGQLPEADVRCTDSELNPAGHQSFTVPYNEVGIFFNISDTRKWLIGANAEWQLHPTVRSVHETEARWWVPDTDILRSLHQVNNAAEVLPFLKSIPAAELERKLGLVHQFGTRFSFSQKITQPPNAVNSLLSGMCMKQKAFPPKPLDAKLVQTRM